MRTCDHVIERWWQRQPGNLVCLSVKFDERQVRDYFFDRHCVDVDGFLARHDNGMRGLSFYFVPHLFVRRRRVKQNAVSPKGAYADLDHVDPRKLGKLTPTVAIATSPSRYQGLWQTDAPVSEALNKRLTYHLGADKSGWDRTQLLRVPGCWNCKYDPPALVKVLWDDGPVHEVAALERALPPLPTRRIGDNERRASLLSMQEILDRHHIVGWLRRELLGSGQVGSERRHRMHWKLACSLREAGVGPQEGFVLLEGTAWNKHAEDTNGDDAVWGLVNKVWNDEPIGGV